MAVRYVVGRILSAAPMRTTTHPRTTAPLQAIVPAAAPAAPRPRATARPQVHVVQPRGRERGSVGDGDDGVDGGDAPGLVPAVTAATQLPAAPLHEAGSKVEVPAVTVPIASANATNPFLRAAPATPRTPGGKAAFPYYCPLCMVHYAAVLETTCCRNYVCAPCATDYLLRTSFPFAWGCNTRRQCNTQHVLIPRPHVQDARRRCCMPPRQRGQSGRRAQVLQRRRRHWRYQVPHPHLRATVMATAAARWGLVWPWWMPDMQTTPAPTVAAAAAAAARTAAACEGRPVCRFPPAHALACRAHTALWHHFSWRSCRWMPSRARTWTALPPWRRCKRWVVAAPARLPAAVASTAAAWVACAPPCRRPPARQRRWRLQRAAPLVSLLAPPWSRWRRRTARWGCPPQGTGRVPGRRRPPGPVQRGRRRRARLPRPWVIIRRKVLT